MGCATGRSGGRPLRHLARCVYRHATKSAKCKLMTFKRFPTIGKTRSGNRWPANGAAQGQTGQTDVIFILRGKGGTSPCVSDRRRQVSRRNARNAERPMRGMPRHARNAVPFCRQERPGHLVCRKCRVRQKPPVLQESQRFRGLQLHRGPGADSQNIWIEAASFC